MLFKAVVQSLQYAVYDLEFDTLKEACIAADGIDPMNNSALPCGITVSIPLIQNGHQVIMIQDQYGNPINLLLSGYATGGTN
jgi:hypothetical protein